MDEPLNLTTGQVLTDSVGTTVVTIVIDGLLTVIEVCIVGAMRVLVICDRHHIVDDTVGGILRLCTGEPTQIILFRAGHFVLVVVDETAGTNLVTEVRNSNADKDVSVLTQDVERSVFSLTVVIRVVNVHNDGVDTMDGGGSVIGEVVRRLDSQLVRIVSGGLVDRSNLSDFASTVENYN